MIFHFQIEGEKGWESLGAGEGRPEDPLGGALDDVRRLCGGSLPEGLYRFIDPKVAGARWQSFELGVDEQIIGDS